MYGRARHHMHAVWQLQLMMPGAAGIEPQRTLAVYVRKTSLIYSSGNFRANTAALGPLCITRPGADVNSTAPIICKSSRPKTFKIKPWLYAFES